MGDKVAMAMNCRSRSLLRRRVARRGPMTSLPRRVLAHLRRFSSGNVDDGIAMRAVGWTGTGRGSKEKAC